MADKLGGWSDTKNATVVTQEICNEVKVQVMEKTGKNYDVYTAVKYRHTENNMNFLIKVHVGEADYIHLSVFQSPFMIRDALPPPVLLGVEQHKTKDDPLVPFGN